MFHVHAPTLSVLSGFAFSPRIPRAFAERSDRTNFAFCRIDWASHRVLVSGLVDSPLSLSMADILAMPAVTVTATLVCAGNRRKEENMVKKTIGVGEVSRLCDPREQNAMCVRR